jgi:hypothetical protein
MGVRAEQLSPIGTVPGTGGVDIDALHSYASGRPSTRLVDPVAESVRVPVVEGTPVFQALVTHWDRLPPCELHLLAMEPETRMWFHALPAHISRRVASRTASLATSAAADGTVRASCSPHRSSTARRTRCSRRWLRGASDSLAVDTIRPLVHDASNVLFARNLTRRDREALVRGMHDDVLVDSAAERNLALVRQLADRSAIRPRVVGLVRVARGRRLS